MCQLIAWFCFVALAIVDQHTNNYAWVSYDFAGPEPLGRLEYIEHSCQTCSMSSADTNLAVRRMTMRLNNASCRSLPCEEILEKLKPLKEIQTAAESAESIIKRVESTVDSVAENVKSICKGVFETKREAEKTSASCKAIEDKVERQTALMEEINSKLQFLVDAKEKELEEIKKKWILLGKTENELQQKAKNIEARNQTVIHQEESLKTREAYAEDQLAKAEKKEKWVADQYVIIEAEKKEIEDTKKRDQERRKKVEHGASLLANAATAFLVIVIIVVVVMFYRQFRSRGSSQNHLDAKIDVCHLSMTRERRIFFERVVQPRLATLNIRPYMEYCLLHQPSDFNSIPKAKAYIVHWASQRRSIFSANWTHRGLLRALGRKPFFIMVCDQELADPMPEGVVYDTGFSQIQSEPELREAVAANCLLTYPRDVDNLNRSQERVLVNWLNANIGEGAFAGEFVS